MSRLHNDIHAGAIKRHKDFLLLTWNSACSLEPSAHLQIRNRAGCTSIQVPGARPPHSLHVGPLLSRPTCLMSSSDSDTCSSNNFWPQESYFSINGGTHMCQTDLSPQGVTATWPGTSAPTSRYYCCALWSGGRSTGGERCFKLTSASCQHPLGPVWSSLALE